MISRKLQNLYMDNLGKNAKKASIELSLLENKKKNSVLETFNKYIKKNKNSILLANSKDLKRAKENKLSNIMISRLELNNNKINIMRESIYQITKFKSPLNKVLSSWKRPNGITIKKVSIPIGVIGVIYESRPNVTSDVSALCFKSGNSVILRGGSEALDTNKMLARSFSDSLKIKNCTTHCVQLIKNSDRYLVEYLLSKMRNYLDLIIPRGGKSLVKKVQKYSTVPTVGHLEGICHVYIHRESEINMAVKIVENSKMRNVGICGAAETLLIDKNCLKTHCVPIIKKLDSLGCKIIGDKIIKKIYPDVVINAKEIDWKTEYLAPTISIKSVNNYHDAIMHINKFGTSHTDTIVTKNNKIAKIFLNNVNSSIAIQNASTQFADGSEFGFGAEVGISTGKLHPRGPVGLDQLTSYKYMLYGSGQTRK